MNPVLRKILMQPICAKNSVIRLFTSEKITSDIVNQLDSSRTKGKLFKKLEKPPAKLMSETSIGIRQSESEDMADILNEALQSTSFIGTFKGVSDASMVVEIKEVYIVGDGTHCTALWTSSPLESFIMELNKKHGVDDANKMSLRITKFITKRLQDKEPQFRVALLKKMDFKRIPRVIFKVHEDWCRNTKEDSNEIF
eukprot:gene4651-9223_t